MKRKKSIKLKMLLLHLFTPNRCIWCGKITGYNQIACRQCLCKLPKSPMIFKIGGKYLCISSFKYETPYKNLLIKMKFYNHPELSKIMAYYMAMNIINHLDISQYDYITSVPLHMYALKKRKYNQSKLLALSISKYLNIPYKPMLKKIFQNDIQHLLSVTERKINTKGVFCCINRNKVKGKNILLIDDTITSGNTVSECCRVLSAAGAKSITIATYSKS